MTTRDGQRVGDAAQHPVRLSARAHRLRRVAALLVGAPLLAGLLQVQTAPAAYAATGSGSETTQISVDSLTPTVPVPGGSITVTGTVTDTGKETITGAHIGVEVAPGGPLTSRSAISTASARTGYNAYSDGYQITAHEAAVPDLQPGISRPFTLKVPVSALQLGQSGVYQLGVSITGLTKNAGRAQVLGIHRTFLPWYQHGDAQPTQFTFLWPLIDTPHLAVRSDTNDQQSPTFLNDSLAAELAPGGRLQQLLALGKTLPVTWVIDPDLLAAVDAMTTPYRVAANGQSLSTSTVGTGTEYAKQWLNELKKAVSGHEVIALPFADPDIASIAHQGSKVSGTIGYLKNATDLATNTVQTILGITPSTNVAWPVNGAVDPSVVHVATAGGANEIIARSDSWRETGNLSYTPTSARPIGGGTTAVVADSTLSTAFQGDMLRADDETTAVQNFVSQTLMITMQAPRLQRSIVVAPQRMPTASQAQAMAAAIKVVQRSGWAGTATFAAAAEAKPDPGANRKVPSAGSYPKSLRSQELSTAAFQEIQRTERNLAGFLVILSRPDRVITPFGTAQLRSMSTEWRGSPIGAEDYRNSVSDYLTQLKGLVQLLGKGTITLSGRSATIPVSVKNELGQTVIGLQLKLTSSQGNSLNVGQPQAVSVQGGHTRSFKFDATASRNGLTSVTAQLYTGSGAPYGAPITFTVNVTSITSTVMLVIAVGLLLLVLAGVRMYHQRKRLVALSAADGGAEADGVEDPEPEQPGDRAADTAAQSRTSSGTGEKVDR
jgi:hypothetical protein